MRDAFFVPGSTDTWEVRCKYLLNRRPFRVIGWDEGGAEGREFVVEYRNFAGLALALVYVDISPNNAASARIDLRGETIADNPILQMLRSTSAKAVRKLKARLLSGESA